MKKWKCSVCGYVHTGEEPPEKCPVCGADKSKFVELIEERKIPEAVAPERPAPETIAAAADVEAPGTLYDRIGQLMSRHHMHPISTHIPNGVLPASVVFILLAALFNIAGLAQAAFYNQIFVLLSMPLVLFAGYNEWQRKYGGNHTGTFRIKIICGGVVTGLAFLMVVWQMVTPDVALHGSPHRGLFVFVNLVMLGAAGLAGFLGGKLVFRD